MLEGPYQKKKQNDGPSLGNDFLFIFLSLDSVYKEVFLNGQIIKKFLVGEISKVLYHISLKIDATI